MGICDGKKKSANLADLCNLMNLQDMFDRSAIARRCNQAGNIWILGNTGGNYGIPDCLHSQQKIKNGQLLAEKIGPRRERIIKDITPFRGESSAEQIRAGESSTLQFAIVQGAHLADVRLIYKRFPWIRDEEALVVHREEVPIE